MEILDMYSVAHILVNLACILCWGNIVRIYIEQVSTINYTINGEEYTTRNTFSYHKLTCSSTQNWRHMSYHKLTCSISYNWYREGVASCDYAAIQRSGAGN